MKVLRNTEIPLPEWRAFLNENYHSSPFQTPEWYNLFNSVNGLSAKAFAIADNRRLLALAVVTLQKEAGFKSFFSRRGIIYGGPLVDPGRPEALELLLQILSTTVNGVIYLETRCLSDYTNLSNIFKKHRWAYTPYVNFHVSTSNIQTMMSLVSESRLRQIRKAIKTGVIWKEASRVDEVKVFYNILKALYKTKVKKPLPAWDFFRSCYEVGFGKYLLVHYSDRIIGGIFCPVLNSKVIYELYVCGLDNEYREQYPSVIATWAAMEYANQNGIPLFDFMGAGKQNEDYGVRDFKARFGGKLVEYGRYIKVNNPVLYNIGKLGLKINSFFG